MRFALHDDTNRGGFALRAVHGYEAIPLPVGSPAGNQVAREGDDMRQGS